MATVERALYPLDEAAERLGGISMPLLYKMIADGRILRVKIGRRSFITAETIDAYVAGLTTQAGA